MNENRKMATVRKVAGTMPIEGADRIERVMVDGWVVIDRKDEWHEGDLCVYLEPDTFVSKDVEPLSYLMARGTKRMEHDGVECEGHVLRTIRLRGVYSAGLIAKPSDFFMSPDEVRAAYESGEALDERIGVWEYQRQVKCPDGTTRQVSNPYDQSVAPVTDAQRIQNCADVWDALKKVDAYATVKVDGMSMTTVLDPRTNRLRLFSHHRELGYSDEPADSGASDATRGQRSYDAAKAQGIVDFCLGHPGITVQYELTGPKIQRGITGGFRCHVFAVWDMAKMRKIPYDEIVESGWDAIVASHVRVLDMRASDYDTVADALMAVDKLSGNVVKGKPDEGVVFHVTGQGSADEYEWARVRNKLGPNAEFKVVSQRYLSKEK